MIDSSQIEAGSAIECYTQNKASVGYCAKIAGMCEEDFIKFLGQNKISVYQYDEAEFLEELNNA